MRRDPLIYWLKGWDPLEDPDITTWLNREDLRFDNEELNELIDSVVDLLRHMREELGA